MKNNALANQYKILAQKVANITPEVYAGIALALHRRFSWDYDKISELFAESQEIWRECVQKDINMIQMCEDETGIECAATVNDK